MIENAEERTMYLLASNVHRITKLLPKYGGLVPRTVNGREVILESMGTKNEPFSVLRILDDNGKSQITVEPRDMGLSAPMISVRFMEPGTNVSKPVSIESVPATHWIAIAMTKEGMEEGERHIAKKAQQQKEGVAVIAISKTSRYWPFKRKAS